MFDILVVDFPSKQLKQVWYMYVTINLFLLPVKEKAASIAHFQMFKNVLYLFNLSKALLAGKFIGIVGKKFDLFILSV